MLTYRYKLKDLDNIPKNGYKVFSCFSGGGGSSIGYKIAGYEVIGFNEIDYRQADVYKANLPGTKYPFICPIQELKNKELPKELYNIDILDGSPPCTTFSIVGKREKNWGKEKYFREGQAKQVLDTLYFDFIDLAKKIKPKIILSENVSGLIKGKAKIYVSNIHKELDKAGYYTAHYLLNAKNMGIPQSRERIFFISTRKDLIFNDSTQVDLFNKAPQINLRFNETEIPYKDIEEPIELVDKKFFKLTEHEKKYLNLASPGENFKKYTPNNSCFCQYKITPDKPINTIVSDPYFYHYKDLRRISNKEYILASSFPIDFNFLHYRPTYILGMSVPPLMIAKISKKIEETYLKKLVLTNTDKTV